MNVRHIRQNDTLRERLASEYVLGTLRGGARRRFEAWLRDDALIRRTVSEWQDRLHPMSEFVPAAEPPPQVWRAIESRLNLTPQARPTGRRAFWLGLREDLKFWRGLGMTSTALAAILVSVLLTRQPEVTAPVANYVATLTDDKAQPVMIITGDAKRRQLTVRIVTQQAIATNKSLELWALPKEGAPRSLGLVEADSAVTLPLPENATPQMAPSLAISLEPKGGSPNPAGPTGPVLFKGAWLEI